MKVVFDTSVLAQIIISRRRVLELKRLQQQALTIFTSRYILEELERTLHKRFGDTKQQARVRTRAFLKTSTLVSPTHIPSLSRDPNDDPVIAAAVAGRANFLVSADNDLLELGSVGSVKIITYEEFMSP